MGPHSCLFSSPAESRGCPEGGGKPAGTACVGEQFPSPGLLLSARTQRGEDKKETPASPLAGWKHSLRKLAWMDLIRKP